MICAIGEWLEDVLRRFFGDSLDVEEEFVAWSSVAMILLFDFRSDEQDESAE